MTEDRAHSTPTRVAIDTSSSPDCTIIDVFTHDSVGLLYEITRTLFNLETSVHYAKIGTFLDQVVDVFYVRDADGKKIVDDERLEQIVMLLSSDENRQSLADSTTEIVTALSAYFRNDCTLTHRSSGFCAPRNLSSDQHPVTFCLEHEVDRLDVGLVHPGCGYGLDLIWIH